MLRKLVVVGGLLIVAILAITTINAYLKIHTPTRQVSQKFISYVVRDDASSSYSLFSDTAKSTQSTEDWTKTVTNIAPFFTGRKAAFVSETVGSPSSQTITTYDITGLDNRDYNFVLSLIKENNQWRVYSFTSKLADADTTQKTGSLAN